VSGFEVFHYQETALRLYATIRLLATLPLGILEIVSVRPSTTKLSVVFLDHPASYAIVPCYAVMA
jgi:hypothetical protein